MARYQVEVGGRTYDITVEYQSEKYKVTVGDKTHLVEQNRLTSSRSVLLIGNHALEVDVRPNGTPGEQEVFFKGQEIPVRIEDYNLAQLRKTAGLKSGPAVEKKLRAPMPGLVIGLKIEVGQTVKTGDPLVVIEAMKMENIIKAKADGVVKSIIVQAGQTIEKNEVILEFE